MSHLHIPDGVISPIWWISGYIITVIILLVSINKIQDKELSKKAPLIGVIAALMLIAMSIPLGIIPFHVNLTVLAGVLGGPQIAFVAIFIVNIILALIGHGGVTVIGINTVIIGIEAIIGYYLFKNISKHIKIGLAAISTVIITLLISNTVTLGIINIIAANEIGHRISTMKIFATTGWTALIIILILGIAIESLIVYLILNFINKVRPGIIKIKD